MSFTTEDRTCATCGEVESVSTDTWECSDCLTKRQREEDGLSPCCGANITSLGLCGDCAENCVGGRLDPVGFEPSVATQQNLGRLAAWFAIAMLSMFTAGFVSGLVYWNN